MAILISDLIYSQTLSLPIKTKYQGENAVIISETQMDFISLSILENKANRTRINVLTFRISELGNELKQEKVKNAILQDEVKTTSIEKEIIAKQLSLCENYEIPKQKSAKPLKKILIGFCAGVLTTSIVVSVIN